MKNFIQLIIVLAQLFCATSLIAHTNSNAPVAHAAWQASLQSDETLKTCLKYRLWGDSDVMYDGWTPWDLAIWFREEAREVTDERLHKALTSIYREAEIQSGKDARDLMTRVVLWLGVCKDNPTKAFLLDVASDKSKDGFLRTSAIASYLRTADAEEAKKVLLRFLVEEDRITNERRIHLTGVAAA